MVWKDYAKYTFTYDDMGRKLTEFAENLDKTQTQYYQFSIIEYIYDDEGRVTEYNVRAGNTQDNMNLVSTAEITYDPIRNDVVSVQNVYDVFPDGTKSLNADSYKQIIERDEDGNVIGMYAFTWYDGDFIEVQNLEITYNDKNEPSNLVESQLTQAEENGPLELVPTETYSDCTWYETDGQIISLDEITSGNNRIKTATVQNSEGSDINMSVVYPDDEFDYISTSEFNYLTFIPTKTVMSHKSLENGGFYTKVVTDQDLTAAGAYPVQSITQILHQYDEFQNLIQAQNQTFYGHTMINSWIKGDVENDPETGLPRNYVRSKYVLNEGSDYYGTWEYDYKITYDNWIDVAGIESALVNDNQDSNVMYFDLTGRKVLNPTNGIFIRKDGNRVSKILIR